MKIETRSFMPQELIVLCIIMQLEGNDLYNSNHSNQVFMLMEQAVIYCV